MGNTLYRHFNKTPPVIPILTLSNPTYILVSCFSKFHFNIIFLLVTMIFKWSLTFGFSTNSHVYYSHCPHPATRLDNLYFLQRNRQCSAQTASLLRFLDHARTHTRTHAHMIRTLCTRGISSSRRPLHTKDNRHKTGTSKASAGFETTIPALERLQNYVLDRTVTGKGFIRSNYTFILVYR